MKIEIEKDFPQYFKPSYPEEFELFSHFEVSAGIPTVLFAITTWKENGKPNVCFHSWSCFHGDKTAFFAVMGNLYQHTHTYANIKREKCFCINFLPISYYDKLVDTIKHNDMETDEFAVGHFTLSNAKTIHAPVIQEAFINMECTLKETQDLSGAGIAAIITIGGVERWRMRIKKILMPCCTIARISAEYDPNSRHIPTAYILKRFGGVDTNGSSKLPQALFISPKKPCSLCNCLTCSAAF